MSLKNNIGGFKELENVDLQNINGGFYPLIIIGALVGIAINNAVKNRR